ncbi:MAG: glycoside hydrolase family 127 protein, partial [Alistipes sp.]|nr:glycoside hydrolase family 127 protein [Alistipes sp.]
RVPTWSGDKFVPGELYDYADEQQAEVEVRVNGRKVKTNVVNGFVPVRRAWQAGDEVSLDLPMPVRYNVADERVEADRGKVSITRGPLVYCAEEPDNEAQVSSVVVNQLGAQGEVAPFTDGVLKGIPAITLSAKDATLKLIPYYAWNNRGDGTAMNVWFKSEDAK